MFSLHENGLFELCHKDECLYSYYNWFQITCHQTAIQWTDCMIMNYKLKWQRRQCLIYFNCVFILNNEQIKIFDTIILVSIKI